MITLISNEDDQYRFNRDSLIETCQFFQKEKELQKDNRFIVSNNYEFAFSSETINSFYKYIKKNRMNKKVILSEELEIFCDYLGFKELNYEFEAQKVIGPLLPLYKYICEDENQYSCDDDKNFKSLMKKEKVWKKGYETLKHNCKDVLKLKKAMIKMTKIPYLCTNVSKYITSDDYDTFHDLLSYGKLKYIDEEKIVMISCQLIRNEIDWKTYMCNILNYLKENGLFNTHKYNIFEEVFTCRGLLKEYFNPEHISKN